MKAKIEALQTLLLTFNIPNGRRDLSKPSNVHWLLRNLLIQNGGNKDIDLAPEHDSKTI